MECQILAGDLGDPAGVAARLRTFAATSWRNYVLARLALMAGELDECEALLQDAWRRCDPAADPVLGARVAGQFAMLHPAHMRGGDSAEWAERALRLAPDQTATDTMRYSRLAGLAMSGQAAPVLASLTSLPDPSVASAAELEELLGRGNLRLCIDDLDGALRDLGGVLAASHGRSANFRWVAAAHLGVAEFRAGRWDDAQAHGELALSIATDADQGHVALFCHHVAMLVPAARGEWDTAEAHLPLQEAAATSGFATAVAVAAASRAHLARARGDPEAVVAAFEPLLRPQLRQVMEAPGVGWWLGVLVDALVTVGERERAEVLLGRYEAWVAERGLPSALAAVGQGRGTLAAACGDDADTERQFEAALAHAGRVAAPFERALLQLAYGKVLRRAGRRARAGEQLHAAREVFARLGARPDLDRCEHELAACGLAVGPRRQRDEAALTPQERAVARLVADGMTNRQVARELVISIRTVEYHLGHVYAKLAVTSRSQLAARLAIDEPPLR
jgi:DNA-binding CsgD family transcriptional regulator